MNTISTATVLPCTPTDVNGFLSVVFIGPEKFDPNCMGTLFHVQKANIWAFLVWLCHHNHLYANIPLDSAITDLYPSDGPLPGLSEHVFEDNELNADLVFGLETAVFSKHPAALVTESEAPSVTESLILEKMDVSDPESMKVSGCSFVALAIHNLLPKDDLTLSFTMVGNPLPSTTIPIFFQVYSSPYFLTA
ncbi:uncharacterized protein EDB93DRAFT_1256447 [Suillus bovinus]|uniref:uncharacterized protein n=1 Tax=Suillus bovinus TaxID=48563 RepID=UPI001B868EE5|nr:uncharacterized protein EDB93DRAFT_1256447 [Suillus bovinus]KAG2128942.1 hypothetical protein EDB93DRAFT_1256447 [Suillus bovinus]